MGYRFVTGGLQLAATTKKRFVERVTRLYEQGAATSRIGEYVRHWLRWVWAGGLGTVLDDFVAGVTRTMKPQGPMSAIVIQLEAARVTSRP